MQSEAGHGLSMGADPAIGCKPAELDQQALRLRHRGGRRRVDPGELLPQTRPPGGQLQADRQGIHLQQFGGVIGGAALLLRCRPQPQATPRGQATGPTAALLGTGLTGGHGDQAIHAGGRIKAVAAAEAAVDHQPHPGDGQGAFGNGRGQHDLAGSLAGRCHRLQLGLQVQLAMQKRQLRLLAPGRGLNGPLGRLQFPLPRQENQHGFGRAALVEPVGLQGPHHLPFQPFVRATHLVLHCHRPAPPLALDHLSSIQPRCQWGQIERGRHQQQAQIGAQQLAGLTQQGQAQISLGSAFMEFVHDHAGHAGKFRIGLQSPQEQTRRDHLQTGGCGGAALQPDAVSHPATQLFSQGLGQAGGGMAGRQPAGLQHHNASVVAQTFQQGQRNPGGFAGSGWGLQQ